MVHKFHTLKGKLSQNPTLWALKGKLLQNPAIQVWACLTNIFLEGTAVPLYRAGAGHILRVYIYPLPGPHNGLERRPLRFSTICAKNRVLKIKIEGVILILRHKCPLLVTLPCIHRIVQVYTPTYLKLYRSTYSCRYTHTAAGH